MSRSYLIYLQIVLIDIVSSSYYVTLTGDENVVLGATLHLKAEVFDSYGNPAKGEFIFDWKDNAIPQHTFTNTTYDPVSEWHIAYDYKDGYYPGSYIVQVDVSRYIYIIHIPEPIGRQSLLVNVTTMLNGKLKLQQNNITLNDKYVSNNASLKASVDLTKADDAFLRTNATKILSFWFIDCVYYGVTTGLEFDYKFLTPNEAHYIETLVVATAETEVTTVAPPVTTTVTTTTTSNPNITSTVSTTTVTVSSSTLQTIIQNTSSMVNDLGWNDIFQNMFSVIPFMSGAAPFIGIYKNGTRKSMKIIESFRNQSDSSFCINSSFITHDEFKTYGYFNKKILVQVPINNVTVAGTNWLKHGDVLDLQVKCYGSQPYSYCLRLYSGLYNITGNETCLYEKVIPNCSLPIQHFFKEPATYTYLVILSNKVSKQVTPIAINVYNVTTHAQLSVIVVPVTFVLLAVIFIVFGVAYYMQSRRTMLVEIADFDFANQVNNMEYKTFKERLRDSITNAFSRVDDYDETDNENGERGHRYGSMH